MANRFRKMWINAKALLPSIFFNFYYLPLKQAVKLPIMINKPHLYKMKGKIIIDAPIKHNMIRLGFHGGHMYPNNGIHLTQEGGTTIFKGRCVIGNNSFIVQGKNSTITFGSNFMASTSLKLISYKSVTFGDHTIMGWNCVVMDTNFHPLYDIEKQAFKKAFGPINIGNDNWFASECRIMHSVSTPERCIFGLGSIVTNGSDFQPYCVHGGSPLRVISKNVKLVYDQYMIKDYTTDD